MQNEFNNFKLFSIPEFIIKYFIYPVRPAAFFITLSAHLLHN